MTTTKGQGQQPERVRMDIVAMMTGAGLSAGVGIAAKALGFWKDSGITQVQLEERLKTVKEELQVANKSLDKNNEAFTATLRETMGELRAVVLTVARLQSSQDVTNTVAAKALDALARKSENHDKIISEIQGAIGQILAEVKRRD